MYKEGSYLPTHYKEELKGNGMQQMNGVSLTQKQATAADGTSQCKLCCE